MDIRSMKLSIRDPVLAVAIARYGGQRTIGIGMAGSGAVPQFAHRVIGGGRLRFAMLAGFIFIGVATGAIGRIGRIAP